MLGAVAQVTDRAALMTYVTCPTMRYHPAVVARAPHFRVDAAGIWDLPDRAVPLGVAVSGRQSCELFAPLADVMIAVEPDGALAGWWDAASGAGRPARKVGQMPVCWGPDRDECIGRAHEQFRWFGGGWKVNAELPGPAGFAGATSFVRPCSRPAS